LTCFAVVEVAQKDIKEQDSIGNRLARTKRFGASHTTRIYRVYWQTISENIGDNLEYIHEKLRPHQQETLHRIKSSKKKFIILQAPTGSGKSFFPAQLAYEGHRTLACVKTKSLQKQYVNSYNFVELFGKGNYECLQFGQQTDFFDDDTSGELSADLCTVPQGLQAECKANCPYPLARSEFLSSNAGTLNYSKFLLDRPVVDAFNPEYLFLDEAHELSDGLVIDFFGINLSWSNRRLKQYTEPVLIDLPQPLAIPKAREYLRELYQSLVSGEPKHPLRGGDKREYRYWKRLKEKIDITLAAMDIEESAWYAFSDDKKLTIKPLTPRFHFLRLFDRAPKIVLMSATIKMKDVQALGIYDYEFIRVPNTVPPMLRPVYNLKSPAITGKSGYIERKEHAKVIINQLNKYPDWNGIIHVTSERMALELGEWIAETKRSVWIPQKGTGTDKAYQNWQEFNSQNESAIAITWQFFAGVDMGDVAINITARTPYPDFGDRFETARFKYNPGQARVRVASTIEQQQGRNRRGFTEHYGANAKKFNAICDKKWERLKPAFDRDFLNSVVSMSGLITH